MTRTLAWFGLAACAWLSAGPASAQTIDLTPGTGTQLSTTFTVSGAGYTPNGLVRRFVEQPTWGGFRRITDIFADSTGRIRFTYVPDCSHQPGTTTIYLQDDNSGHSSIPARFGVSASPSCQVSVDSIVPNPPSYSSENQEIVVRGSGFQSNLTIAVGFPDGNTGSLSGTQIKNVTSNSFTMIITLGSPGLFWIRVRNPNGAESNQFFFNAIVPVKALAITPTTGTRLNTTYVVTGYGYQPNGVVRRYVNQPGWGEYRQISDIQANGLGQIGWNYVPDCAHPIGTTFVYVVDATQILSNPVSFAVNDSPGCQTAAPFSIANVTPSSAVRGQNTTFTVTGSGISPAFSAQLEIDGSTFNIPAVHFTSSSSIQITPFIGSGPSTTGVIRVNSDGQQQSFSFPVYGDRGDGASFVRDVTIPDGAAIPAGQGFTKTWRLRNTGDTNWSGFTLAFFARDRLGTAASVPVNATAPGATADISVPMTAPAAPGTYQGYWRMRNASGTWFGDQIWVSITVPSANGGGGGGGDTSRILTAVTHGLQVFSTMDQQFVRIGSAVDDAIRGRDLAEKAFGDSFVFNWSTQSNNDGYGWAVAAADQLFAILAERLHGQSPVSVHLIGHSLGGSVMSQTATRLLQYGFTVEQVTFLEAVSTKAQWTNPPIRAWQGINRVDNYNGNGCFVLGYGIYGLRLTMPVGKIAPDNSAHEFQSDQYDHSGNCPNPAFESIVQFYLETIKPFHGMVEREGWYWSPLGGGDWTTLASPPSPAPRVQDADTAPSVLNGDFQFSGVIGAFDKSESESLPGYEWTDQQDGHKEQGMPAGTVVNLRGAFWHSNYAAVLRPALLAPSVRGAPVRLRHAPLYIQGDRDRKRSVDTLRFEYSLAHFRGDDHLDVFIGDTPLSDCRPENTSGDWIFIECPLPAGVFNKARVLEFRLSYNQDNWHALPEAWIDNISLERRDSTRVRSDGALWHLASSGAATTGVTSGVTSSVTSDVTVHASPLTAVTEERDVQITIENSDYAAWRVSTDAAWLSYSPSILTGAGGTVHVSMQLSGLAVGTHVATLRVLPEGWAGAPDVGTSVPVIVTIAPPESHDARDREAMTFENGVKLTLYDIAAPSQVTMTQESLKVLPATPGFALPGHAVVYRLRTADAFAGHAVLQLPFDTAALADGARPAVVRIRDDGLEDVTSGIDLERGLVFGAASGLGDFAVVSDTRARSQFLAEGAIGNFFEELIELANPYDRAAEILVKFLQPAAPPVVRPMTLPPRSRHTIDVGRDVPEVAADVSVVIEPVNGLEVIAEREMVWDRLTRYGGHSGGGQTLPSVRWYFAEGATSGPFDLWILLANPHAVEAHIRATYLKEDSSTIVRDYVVPPQARLTISVDAEAGLEAASVSTILESTNGVAVYADRSMYWSSDGMPWRGGTSSPGVARTSPNWFLAEGATGTFFDLYLLLANPGATVVPTRVTYLKTDGTTVVQRYDLPATSRTTISVENIPGLEGGGVSMIVDTLDGAGIIAERAMYWGDPSRGWIEGHTSPGVTQTGTTWAMAGGEVGRDEAATYILIANPSSQPAHVRVTFLREEGRSPVVKDFTIAATSRFNVAVLTGGSGDVPEISSERFGAIVESVDGIGIFVERAVYWNVNGVLWEGGTNGAAQRLKE